MAGSTYANNTHTAKMETQFSYSLPYRTSQRGFPKSASPPSNEMSYPRQSVEQHSVSASAQRRANRESSARANLANAFASEEEGPEIFPSSFYHQPRRSARRRTFSNSGMPIAPSLSKTSSESSDSSRPSDSELSRQSTPEVGKAMSERSYSPMAAGFARLSRKETYGGSPGITSPPHGRGRSTRPSLDLEVRMFEGPA